MFYTVLLLPVISLAYTGLVYVRFKYGQEIDKKFVTKGDKVNFIFNINNEDFFLYPYLRVSFYGAKTIFANQFQVKNFSLSPFRGKSYALELQCNYRGSYEVGINSIEIEDFLGIFRFPYRVDDPKHVTVYPKIIPLDRFYLKTDFLSETHSVLNSRNEDMTTVTDVRSYAYGDSLKKVHWKLTAKTGELMVKKFQSTSETSAVIILDLRQTLLDNGNHIIVEDKVIEAVVSVLHYCLHNWIPVHLMYYSNELHSIHAKNYLMFNEIYEVLAKVRFGDTVPLKDIMEVYTESSISKTNMLLFTANLDYDLYNQIYKASTSGYDVSLIYISSEDVTGVKDKEADNILAFLPEIGVCTYKIQTGDDIRTVLER